MGRTDYFSQMQHEVVRVTAISPRGATCLTSYKSELTIPWGNNLPSPIPQVGETWMVQKFATNRWKFMSRVRSGQYSVMHYAMTLDARSCIGKERAIIDDIKKSGVDEVFLNVADDGLVLWDSDSAEDFGLGCFGDHTTQLIKRLWEYGIAITLMISCRVWSNVRAESVHHKYQQVVYDAEGNGSYTAIMSPKAAAEPMRVMVEELYSKYQPYVRGVCFSDFVLAGEHADFSLAARNEYVKRFGVEPTYSLTEYDPQVKDWWRKHFEWMSFQADLQKDFLATVKRNIGNWPVSAITASRVMCPTESGVKVGRLSTGIQDDFGTYGWEMVGFPMAYTKQSDPAAELRSLEYLIACEQRFAKGCSPFYLLDIKSLTQYGGVFELLSKYDASTVILDDYDHWRLLSDQQVIELGEAMNSYRVSEKSDLDCVGVLLSSNSRDIYAYDYETNTKFSKSIENMCASLLDKLPHKLKVFFDSDMEDVLEIKKTAALVSFMASNLTDNAIDTLETLIAGDDRNVVLVGRTGYMMGSTDTERERYPLMSYFKQSEYRTQEYLHEIIVGAGQIDVAKNAFILQKNNIGIKPVLDYGGTESYIQTVSGGVNVLEKVLAPLFFHDRSSMLGIDVIRDDLLLEVASELALYALGRDS